MCEVIELRRLTQKLLAIGAKNGFRILHVHPTHV